IFSSLRTCAPCEPHIRTLRLICARPKTRPFDANASPPRLADSSPPSCPTRTSCGREDIWRWRRKLHDAAFTGPRGGRGLGGAGGDPSEAWQEVMTGEAGEVLESRSGSSPVDRRLRRLQKCDRSVSFCVTNVARRGRCSLQLPRGEGNS